MLVGFANADSQPDPSPNHSADASHHRWCIGERRSADVDPDCVGVTRAHSVGRAQRDSVGRAQRDSISRSQRDSISRPQPTPAQLGYGRGRSRRRSRVSR